MRSIVEEGHHRRDKRPWASSLRVPDPCRRPTDSKSAGSCVSLLFRALSKAIPSGLCGARQRKGQCPYGREAIVALCYPLRNAADGPSSGGWRMYVVSFLCFLTCSSPQQESKLLQDATELDWAGLRSPRAVACRFLDLVQATKRSTAENLRVAAASRP